MARVDHSRVRRKLASALPVAGPSLRSIVAALVAEHGCDSQVARRDLAAVLAEWREEAAMLDPEIRRLVADRVLTEVS